MGRVLAARERSADTGETEALRAKVRQLEAELGVLAKRLEEIDNN